MDEKNFTSRIGSRIDSLIESVAPRIGVDRQRARSILRRAKAYGNAGASTTRSALATWYAKANSPRKDIDDNVDVLRARSRELFMSSPLGRGAIDTMVKNCVGAGLMLDAEIDGEFLGLTDEESDAIEVQIEREFRLWSDNQDALLNRSMTFSQAQSLVMLSAMLSGDVFVGLSAKPRKGRAYDLRLNIIESDRVLTPMDLRYSGTNVVEGVEMGEDGSPVAYHISSKHPSDGLMSSNIVRVPAFNPDTGRRNVLHLMSSYERPGQVRGLPFLSPVIESIKQLTRYSEAEVTAAVISSYFTVFVTTDAPGGLGPQFKPPGLVEDEARPELNPKELAPGIITELAPGEKIDIANPTRPNQGYDGFTSAVLRQVGAGLGIPYEVLMKTYSSSYSASRGSRLEAQVTFKTLQESLVINSFCKPVYEEFLAEAVAKGRIDMPGFFSDPAIRAAWSGSRWYGHSHGQLDPLKEAEAARVRVEQGFSTRAREAAELSGDDYENIHKIRKREERMRREDGLAPDDASQIAIEIEEEEVG